MERSSDFYTREDVLEIIRQCIYLGDPDYYERGGINGNINFPPNGTYAKAEQYFENYYLNNKNNQHGI